jgi:hypothetical protein
VVCVIVGAVSGHAVSPWINGYGAVPPVPAAAFVPLVPPVPATAFVPLVPPVPAAALVLLVPPVPAAALVLLVPPVPATAFVLLVPPTLAPELELASPPAVPALSGVALLVPACCGLGASTAPPQPWTSQALRSNHELTAHPARRFITMSGQQDPDRPEALLLPENVGHYPASRRVAVPSWASAWLETAAATTASASTAPKWQPPALADA